MRDGDIYPCDIQPKAICQTTNHIVDRFLGFRNQGLKVINRPGQLVGSGLEARGSIYRLSIAPINWADVCSVFFRQRLGQLKRQYCSVAQRRVPVRGCYALNFTFLCFEALLRQGRTSYARFLKWRIQSTSQQVITLSTTW